MATQLKRYEVDRQKVLASRLQRDWSFMATVHSGRTSW